MSGVSQPATSRTPRWSWWLVAIMMIGAGLPLLVAALSGNLTIPHDDGWAYSRITETFARTGKIRLLGWNRTSLIGQVVMLGPFGRSLAVQQVAMAVFAALTLGCVYLLTARSLSRPRALLATLLVALWPGFAALATSFMSDMPALLGTFGSLALGTAALHRDSRRLLWLSLLVGLWATTVREQSLLAPATVLAYGWLTRTQRRELNGRELTRSAVALTMTALAFVLWRQSLPRGDHPSYRLAPHAVISAFAKDTVILWFTLALPLLPAIAFGARGRHHSRRAIQAALVVAAIGLVCHGLHMSLLSGAYIQASGQDQLGSSIFGPTFATGLQFVTWISGVLMAAVVVDRWRASEPVLGGFTLATLIATIAIGASGQSFNDRYLIALAPGVLAILLSGEHVPAQTDSRQSATGAASADASSPNRCSTLATLIALTIFSSLLTLNHFAYDRALWNAATALVKAGLPARRIESGQVWDGVHAPHGVIDERLIHSVAPIQAFERPLPCVIVTRFTQIEGTELVGRFHYKRFLLFGNSYLNLLKVTQAQNCPALKSSVG